MLDGYGVAARIRAALGTSITLVAMTGYGQEADKERALAAGFDVHLVKPVAAEDLKQVLSKLSAIEERDAGRNKHPQEQQEQAQTAQPQR
jgi:CheY-like chemotaxis protein